MRAKLFSSFPLLVPNRCHQRPVYAIFFVQSSFTDPDQCSAGAESRHDLSAPILQQSFLDLDTHHLELGELLDVLRRRRKNT